VLGNDVTVVVNFYDVESPTPDCCKSNLCKGYCVENFGRIELIGITFLSRFEFADY
jgi:hypothetical protein